jgi:hypothetical protein
MPEVLVFLIEAQPGMDAEKEAFAHGIDAVFEKGHDCESIVKNARAACAWNEPQSAITKRTSESCGP